MDVTPQRITDIQSSIIDKMADALEKGDILEDDLPEMARFVLDRTKQITKEEELLIFLDDLAREWPFFQPVENLEKGRAKEELEEQIVEDVLQLAKNGQISQAVDLAKTATQ